MCISKMQRNKSTATTNNKWSKPHLRINIQICVRMYILYMSAYVYVSDNSQSKKWASLDFWVWTLQSIKCKWQVRYACQHGLARLRNWIARDVINPLKVTLYASQNVVSLQSPVLYWNFYVVNGNVNGNLWSINTWIFCK